MKTDIIRYLLPIVDSYTMKTDIIRYLLPIVDSYTMKTDIIRYLLPISSVHRLCFHAQQLNQKYFSSPKINTLLIYISINHNVVII